MNVKLGKYNQLEVVKEVDFGVYLDGGDDGEILLPTRYVPEGCKPGDVLNVFLYLDNEEANMRTIEDERILELTYEGSRFFDLLRWGKVVERFRELENTDPLFKRFSRAQYMGFKENKNEWVPLPIDEVEGNPYITKNNPGW